MDREWQEWTSLWQKQALPELSVEEAAGVLSKLARKARQQRLFLLLSFSSTAIFLVSMAILFGGFCTSAGVSLMLLAMAMILYQAYRHPLQAVKDVAQFDQQTFLTTQLHSLEQSQLLTSRYMWIYAGLLIVGINLTYLDALANLDMRWRVAIAAAVSLALGLGFAYSIPRHLAKLRQQIAPIQQQLEAWRLRS